MTNAENSLHGAKCHQSNQQQNTRHYDTGKKTYPKKKPLKKTLKVDGKNVNTQNRRQMTEKGGLRQREGNECHDN